jgi:hypothetical protein
LRIFAENFGVRRYGWSRQPLLRFRRKIFSVASSMRYVKFSERAPIRALDARRFFAALPRVRARLAELRAARFATLHIVNHQQTRERRARPPRRVNHSPPGGRAPIRAGFISASEDEP